VIILGHGIDLVDVAKVTQLVERRSESQLLRIFTSDELAYCNKNVRRKAEHLAARFAAKEAVAKALGTGFTKGVAWFEIEVAHDETGRPTVRLAGRTAEVAKSMGVVHLHLSLSHINEVACASVIAEGVPATMSVRSSCNQGDTKAIAKLPMKKKARSQSRPSDTASTLKPKAK